MSRNYKSVFITSYIYIYIYTIKYLFHQFITDTTRCKSIVSSYYFSDFASVIKILENK